MSGLNGQGQADARDEETENNGYMCLVEDEENREVTDDENEVELPAVDPQVSLLVDRALKRLEDEYARTVHAKWTQPLGDERIDRLLEKLERRLGKLEDDLEDEEAAASFEPIFDNIRRGSSSAINADEIKRQAQCLDFGFKSSNEEQEWMARMLGKLTPNRGQASGDLGWMQLALEKLKDSR